MSHENKNTLEIHKEKVMLDLAMICTKHYLDNFPVKHSYSFTAQYVTLRYIEFLNNVKLHFDHFSHMNDSEISNEIMKMVEEMENIKRT